MPCQEATTTFLKIIKSMEIDPNQLHIRPFELRIKPFESQTCYQSNGTPPDPHNCHIKFEIEQKSNGPHRQKCTLNLAINRIMACHVLSYHGMACQGKPLLFRTISGVKVAVSAAQPRDVMSYTVIA